MKATREEVYRVIDGERDYQDSMPPSRTDGSIKSVGDYITLMDSMLRSASDTFYTTPGVTGSLDWIRKVAAISVRCLEEHGAPPRVLK